MVVQTSSPDSLFSLPFVDALRRNMVTTLAGVATLALLAQISVPLPFTPVPITGQTFGVALIALIGGRQRAVACVALYLLVGAAGAPVFAQAQSGLAWGPTAGYLGGMLAAAFVMGILADRGWTKSFFRTWLAATFGSLITFGFGVAVLSIFLPADSLFTAGVLPFLPGDGVKTLLVSAIVHRLSKGSRSKALTTDAVHS